MAPKQQKISKQAAAVKIRNTAFTITETLEITRKPGNVTCQTVIMAAYMIGLLTIYVRSLYVVFDK
jgi:hypothetical protein